MRKKQAINYDFQLTQTGLKLFKRSQYYSNHAYAVPARKPIILWKQALVAQYNFRRFYLWTLLNSGPLITDCPPLFRLLNSGEATTMLVENEATHLLPAQWTGTWFQWVTGWRYHKPPHSVRPEPVEGRNLRPMIDLPNTLRPCILSRAEGCSGWTEIVNVNLIEMMY